ncbi:MAG: hypothetical protein AB1Z65_12405 [Candidatus Sulfomarinibacteraceae bacterium]
MVRDLAPAPPPAPAPGCGAKAFREREREREEERIKAPLVSLIALLSFLALSPLSTFATDIDLSGRVSPQFGLTTYPDNSLFDDVFGSSSFFSAFDARVIFGLRHNGLSFEADYQLIGIYADQLELSRDLPPELQVIYPHIPSDRTRLFDLTYVFNDAGKTETLQRLDRLSVGFTTEHVVMNFGRQAVTWGNGLMYTAMDIFNPFDPAAVDKEYKTGDDMIYGQVLQNNGNDIQGVMVFRRDPVTGDVEADQGSLAFKYHMMGPSFEIDALAARHYGDTLLGVGANVSIGGGVLRGDLVVADTDDGFIPTLVASWSQSWVWGGRNVSGVAEYFHNGFGRSDGCYSPVCLAENPELYKRIARRELYNLGRHYLALSAMIEVTPLFLLTPNIFINLDDPSALAQLVFQNDLLQNLQLWSAVAVPIGADGTEYGGAASGIPGRYLSAGPSVSVQLVWYW